MTNEEIEEQAEDYEMNCIADVYQDDVCTIPYAYSAQKLEQAFQDGAKWGMEHAIEWHKLKENPYDLPSTQNYKCNQDGDTCWYDEETDQWLDIEGTRIKVIAWCELPQYKE